MGNFQQTIHGVSGKVVITDYKTITIYGFSYDGLGPGKLKKKKKTKKKKSLFFHKILIFNNDTIYLHIYLKAGLFWGSTGGRDSIATKSLIIPDESCNNGDTSGHLPVYNNKTVTLTLPLGVTVFS